MFYVVIRLASLLLLVILLVHIQTSLELMSVMCINKILLGFFCGEGVGDVGTSFEIC